jgi:uroporphyrinogen decarboxylase
MGSGGPRPVRPPQLPVSLKDIPPTGPKGQPGGCDMQARERLQAVLRGDPVDRPPLALWHHFRSSRTPAELAQATVDFFGRLELDIFKVMPDLPYPEPEGGLSEAAAWRDLPLLPDDSGRLAEIAETVALVRQARPDAAIVQTVFSPLATAIRLVGGRDRLADHLEEDARAVHQGLAVIADNLARLGAACIRRGADGMYFATAGQADGLFDARTYASIGRPYDLQALAGCGAGWLNVVHMHGGAQLNWDWAADYPAQVFSWSDRQTGVPLAEVAQRLPARTVMGGIDEFGAIMRGDMDAVAAEMHDAVRQMGGRRLILAGGCSVPDEIDEAHLAATRRLVDQLAG